MYTESICEFPEVMDSDVLLTTLDHTYIGAMNLGLMAELFLRNTHLLAFSTDPLAQKYKKLFV